MKCKKAMIVHQYLVIFIITLFISIAAFQYFMFEHKTTGARTQTSAEESVKGVGGKGLELLEIYFQNGLDDTKEVVDFGYIRAKTKPNSDHIGYKDIAIAINTEHAELKTYSYNKDINCDSKDKLNTNSIYHPIHENSFGIKNYFSENNTHIQKNDVILFCFKTPYGLTLEEQVITTITIKQGLTTTWTDNLPAIMNKESVYLYPRNAV